MDGLRYEVYVDDNTGGAVAAFRWLDDARVYAKTLDGLVFDTHEQADVTYSPRGPAMAEHGHDLRPEWARSSL